MILRNHSLSSVGLFRVRPFAMPFSFYAYFCDAWLVCNNFSAISIKRKLYNNRFGKTDHVASRHWNKNI